MKDQIPLRTQLPLVISLGAAAVILALTDLGASIDAKVDAALSPVTNFVSSIVFYAVPIDGVPFPLIVGWLMAGGLFFTFYMRFINIRGFAQALRVVSGRYSRADDPGEVTHFQALSTAVSGTVGLGNIAGVAIAISIGGPGATFWMILAGLFGMTTKFVECTLGLKYRRIDENGVVTGGPIYYLSDGLAKRGLPGLGKILAAFSAMMCIAGAFGSGALFQVNQAGQQFANVLVPLTGGETSIFNAGWLFGLIYAAFAASVIIGGIRKIAQVTSFLVPFMGLLYLGTALVVILVNYQAIPDAFTAIFTGAFAPEGVAGGAIGVLIQGIRRANFSNEAGLGSAPIAHAAAKTEEPISEGLVALLEPFIDTVVICTATALVIIITGQYQSAEVNDGILLTSSAFASAISWFPYLLAVAVVLFAFSTSITWFYYGRRSLQYLMDVGPRADRIFKIVFLVFIVAGSSMQLGSIINFADSVILGMAIPNLIGLYILAPEVREMLGSYFARLRNGEIAARPAVAQISD